MNDIIDDLDSIISDVEYGDITQNNLIDRLGRLKLELESNG